MNSKTSGYLRCCRKTALKKVKGFTLLELIIVVAIISILAGISSVLVTGFIRDANCESVNNRAQQVYASVQNLLVECEIDNNSTFIDPSYIGTGTKGNYAYVNLALNFNNGELDKTTTTVTAMSATSTASATYALANTQAAEAYDTLVRYLSDTLSSDFTGYAYVCIDLESYVVDSVVYFESYEKGQQALNGANAFCDEYEKIGTFASKTTKRLYGCKDIYHQKDIYDETGVYTGFHPYMSNVSTEYKLVSDKYPHI